MRVALFVSCLVDALFPGVGHATVALLERLGQDVEFPLAQTCCGQMHTNSGYPSVGFVRSFVDAFEDYDAIVVPSASCASSIRHQHPMIARTAGQQKLSRRSARIADRVFELSEFVVDVLDMEDVGAYFPHRVVYHPTCHSLRELKVGDRPTRLLQAVRGIDVIELPRAEECCGFGGTFAVKNSDVSISMLADKMRAVTETGAEIVCATDSSCLMHIGGGLTRIRAGVGTLHLAEILATTDPRQRDPVMDQAGLSVIADAGRGHL